MSTWLSVEGSSTIKTSVKNSAKFLHFVVNFSLSYTSRSWKFSMRMFSSEIWCYHQKRCHERPGKLMLFRSSPANNSIIIVWCNFVGISTHENFPRCDYRGSELIGNSCSKLQRWTQKRARKNAEKIIKNQVRKEVLLLTEERLCSEHRTHERSIKQHKNCVLFPSRNIEHSQKIHKSENRLRKRKKGKHCWWRRGELARWCRHVCDVFK